MIGSEHIHIITAGKEIYPAYAKILRDYPDRTHTLVRGYEALYQ